MRVLDSFSKAGRDFLVGLRQGYPTCCVLNYALDSLRGIPAGLSRGVVSGPSCGDYVPCRLHKRVRRALSSRESLTLLNSGFSVEHLAPQDLIETRVNGKVITRMRIPEGLDAVFLSQVKLTD